MIIDIIYLLLLAAAIWKGYRKGLIVALCSVAALIIGLAAATKLSASVAGWLHGNTTIGIQWLPFVSFILIMMVVALLARLVSGMAESATKILMMGWANKLAGVLLYMTIYTIVFSVLLFYLVQLGIIKNSALQVSECYSFIQPWGIKAINGIGVAIPFFKNIFAQLQIFFESFSEKK